MFQEVEKVAGLTLLGDRRLVFIAFERRRITEMCWISHPDFDVSSTVFLLWLILICATILVSLCLSYFDFRRYHMILATKMLTAKT